MLIAVVTLLVLGLLIGLGLGWGPTGMWLGLIAGLSVAAVLLGSRFVRASAPARLAARRDAPRSAER